MTFTNFTLDIDADGIALVTWNAPGRSMNVIDATVIEELSAIVEQVAGRCRRQGRGHHLGQGHVLRRRRSHDAGDAEPHLRRAGGVARRGGGECAAVRGKPQAVAALPPHRDLRQAVGRGDQRHRGRRRLRTGARLPSSRRRRQRARRGSACRRSRSVCFRAPAARSASRACCRRPMRCNSCSRATSIGVDRAKAMKLIDAVVPAGDLIKAAKDWIKAERHAPRRRGTSKDSGCRAGRSIPRPA